VRLGRGNRYLANGQAEGGVMTATQEIEEGRTISRADIESKLREIRGEVETTGNNVKQYAIVAGAVVAVAVVALAFTLGKRKGKRKTTVVEVRRV
jgi:hypothetical protein